MFHVLRSCRHMVPTKVLPKLPGFSRELLLLCSFQLLLRWQTWERQASCKGKRSQIKASQSQRSRGVVDGGASLPLLVEVGVRSRRTVWKRSRGSHCILLRNWRRSRRQVKICLLQGLGWVVGGVACWELGRCPQGFWLYREKAQDLDVTLKPQKYLTSTWSAV